MRHVQPVDGTELLLVLPFQLNQSALKPSALPLWQMTEVPTPCWSWQVGPSLAAELQCVNNQNTHESGTLHSSALFAKSSLKSKAGMRYQNSALEGDAS